MRIERVVVNASPIICLYRGGMGDLLGKLWATVDIPEAVWQEIARGPENDAAAQQLPTAQWARRIEVAAVPESILRWDLGAGESEVLAAAMNNPGYRVIVDDRQAGRCARTLDIPVLGTAGVLVLAKRRRLIASVGQAISQLRDSGLWISDSVVDLIKRIADEG